MKNILVLILIFSVKFLKCQEGPIDYSDPLCPANDPIDYPTGFLGDKEIIPGLFYPDYSNTRDCSTTSTSTATESSTASSSSIKSSEASTTTKSSTLSSEQKTTPSFVESSTGSSTTPKNDIVNSITTVIPKKTLNKLQEMVKQQQLTSVNNGTFEFVKFDDCIISWPRLPDLTPKTVRVRSSSKSGNETTTTETTTTTKLIIPKNATVSCMTRSTTLKSTTTRKTTTKPLKTSTTKITTTPLSTTKTAKSTPKPLSSSTTKKLL